MNRVAAPSAARQGRAVRTGNSPFGRSLACEQRRRPRCWCQPRPGKAAASIAAWWCISRGVRAALRRSGRRRAEGGASGARSLASNALAHGIAVARSTDKHHAMPVSLIRLAHQNRPLTPWTAAIAGHALHELQIAPREHVRPWNSAMPTAEAQLDTALGEALSKNAEFSQWFLGKTRFRNEVATCVFCRSNNPWSSVLFEAPNPVSGELESLARECEMDVLAVYETSDQRRLALHIENKLAGGSFTPDQPALYRERLQQWRNRPKLGLYSDATSVLVAPQEFFNRLRAQSEVFDAFISHEEIALRLPAFAPAPRAGV